MSHDGCCCHGVFLCFSMTRFCHGFCHEGGVIVCLSCCHGVVMVLFIDGDCLKICLTYFPCLIHFCLRSLLCQKTVFFCCYYIFVTCNIITLFYRRYVAYFLHLQLVCVFLFPMQPLFYVPLFSLLSLFTSYYTFRSYYITLYYILHPYYITPCLQTQTHVSFHLQRISLFLFLMGCSVWLFGLLGMFCYFVKFVVVLPNFFRQ